MNLAIIIITCRQKMGSKMGFGGVKRPLQLSGDGCVQKCLLCVVTIRNLRQQIGLDLNL